MNHLSDRPWGALGAHVVLLAALLLMAPFALSQGLGTQGQGALGPGNSADERPEGAVHHVVVFHTNDVHGQVLPRPATWLKDVNPIPDSGGLPRLAANLRALREEAVKGGAAVVLCDGGDWFQGTPEGQIDQGLGFLRAFAAVGHDGAVVGNHEFDHGVDVLISHLSAAPLPALLANVRRADGSPLPGTRDFALVERAGLRIALVGLLTVTTPSITHRQTKDLLWEAPETALGRVRDELRGRADLVIPVTHLGVGSDRALARAHPDLPLIVGGHSHTFLRKGVREGQTLVVQTGSKASVIGRVDLWLDADLRVLRSQARHIDLYGEPADGKYRNAEVDGICEALVQDASDRMSEVVGVLGRGLKVTRRELENSTSGNFIADLIRARSGADIAVHNRGGIRTSLLPGPVTRRDLFMLLPFDNHVETLTMSGADVIELFRRSIENERKRPLEFSGARLAVRLVEGKPKLLEVRAGGRAIDPAATYRLASNSFLTGGGDGWQILADQEVREVDFMVLRDILVAAMAGGPLTPSNEQRYEIQP